MQQPARGLQQVPWLRTRLLTIPLCRCALHPYLQAMTFDATAARNQGVDDVAVPAPAATQASVTASVGRPMAAGNQAGGVDVPAAAAAAAKEPQPPAAHHPAEVAQPLAPAPPQSPALFPFIVPQLDERGPAPAAAGVAPAVGEAVPVAPPAPMQMLQDLAAAPADQRLDLLQLIVDARFPQELRLMLLQGIMHGMQQGLQGGDGMQGGGVREH